MKLIQEADDSLQEHMSGIENESLINRLNRTGRIIFRDAVAFNR